MKISRLLLVVLIVVGLSSTASFAAQYAGSDACFTCHPDKYNDWKTSGHPYKLRTASNARYAPLPLPKGYTWDDISYVIGGHRWKARYMDKQGYIITGDKEGKAMPTQWNIKTGKWVDYNPGKKTPYKCGPCHMTAYSPEGHQDGLEGIVGTWTAPGIHCEECHGTGSEHIAGGDKTKIKVDKSSSACGKCHIRGEKEKIPAKAGFIEHHEQYNEYIASPHKDKVECVICHDPHKPARFGIRKACVECHSKQEAEFKDSTMQKAGIRCIDCHMPKVGKSAEAKSKLQADVRTHNWKISLDPKAMMFTEDGKSATGILTLDFVCLNCHGSKDMKWAGKKAKKAHTIGK
ncbi:MAG: cytochrome c3 family protein [Nitrospirae bacterium]|nr:cytochrome c3 family protein [Nitrospirota bacterium]